MTERIIGLVLDESHWLPLAMVVSVIVVVAQARRYRRQGVPRKSSTLCGLNLFYGSMLGLMAIGPQNWPLAAPSVLNIAYRFQVRPAVGLAIVGVVGVGYLALFAGAVVFLASGQTFEQFQGMTN